MRCCWLRRRSRAMVWVSWRRSLGCSWLSSAPAQSSSARRSSAIAAPFGDEFALAGFDAHGRYQEGFVIDHRLGRVADLQGAVIQALDDDALGQRQGNGEVDLAVVEDVGLELDGVPALLEVLHQLALVD